MPQWSEEDGREDTDAAPWWLAPVAGLGLVVGVAAALWLWWVTGGVFALTTCLTAREDATMAPADRRVTAGTRPQTRGRRQVVDHIGPCTKLVYDTLWARVVGGEIAPGEQLPSCVVLAGQVGAAPLTVRQVLAQSG